MLITGVGCSRICDLICAYKTKGKTNTNMLNEDLPQSLRLKSGGALLFPEWFKNYTDVFRDAGSIPEWSNSLLHSEQLVLNVFYWPHVRLITARQISYSIIQANGEHNHCAAKGRR